MAKDVLAAARFVNTMVKLPLTQCEFDALVDFVFNLGPGNFARSTLLTALNAGDFARAAAQFECWDRAGGIVVAGLLRRRGQSWVCFKTKPDSGKALSLRH